MKGQGFVLLYRYTHCTYSTRLLYMETLTGLIRDIRIDTDRYTTHTHTPARKR